MIPQKDPFDPGVVSKPNGDMDSGLASQQVWNRKEDLPRKVRVGNHGKTTPAAERRYRDRGAIRKKIPRRALEGKKHSNQGME